MAKWTSNIQVLTPRLDAVALADHARANPEDYVRIVDELINGQHKVRFKDVRDMRYLFRGLADVQVPTHVSVMGETRAVMASAFPVLCGQLMIAGISDAYDQVATIGEDLVTEIEDNKKVSHFVQILPDSTSQEMVREDEDFPPIFVGEERFDIMQRRNGYRLGITAEMLEENDISGVQQRIDALGEFAAEDVEELTIKRVFDLNGSATAPAEPYTLHLNGTGTALYTTVNTTQTRLHASGNQITNNALVDETDLEAARLRLSGMLNARGKRINMPVNQMQLVVPTALEPVATKILGSEMVPGVFNELSPWGPRGAYRPQPVSSPKIDALINSTTWLMGNCKKLFKRKWKLRFEYVTMSGDTESFLRSRIAFQARVAWDCEVGAVDQGVYVIRSLSGTTAP